MESKSEPFQLLYLFVIQREILWDCGVLVEFESLHVVPGFQELQKAWKAVKGGGGGSLHSAAALCSLVHWLVIG